MLDITPETHFNLIVEAALHQDWNTFHHDKNEPRIWGDHYRFDLRCKMAALQLPCDPVTGWPIEYPSMSNIKQNTIFVVHIQDNFNFRDDNSCIELEKIEKYFGEYANRVIVVHWNYGIEKTYAGPMKLVYHPSHSVELYKEVFDTEDKWSANFNTLRKINYQCLNGLPRRHRVDLVRHLVECGLSDYGMISLGDEIKLPKYDYFSSYYECSNQDNWLRLQYVYSQTALNIVTETQYKEHPGIISEKTLFAFCAKQVPIVIGYKGIVADLEELGFDMFRDIVDTSYDTLENNVRWDAALTSNTPLLKTGLRVSLQESIKRRLDANFERLREYPMYWNKRLYTDLIDAGKQVAAELGLVNQKSV